MSTDRMWITHVTFTGSAGIPASVEFGPALNVVRGPSDTGKSFIVDAIDYMLGGQSLRYIPQRDGYSTVLMGLEFATAERITLARRVDGGSFSVYEGDHRQVPADVVPVALAPTHNEKSKEIKDISRYLLVRMGLANRRVRKNIHNQTVSLTIRAIAGLCVVNETRMQDASIPGTSGQQQQETKELSALKLLLTGVDDSELIAVTPPRERKKLGDAQIQILDQLIAAKEEELRGSESRDEVRLRASRVASAIKQLTNSISDRTRSRGSLAREIAVTQSRKLRAVARAREVRSLHARFSLLATQYETDLARLETVSEAGNLLGFFTPGTCVVCGAAPEHQAATDHDHGTPSSFQRVIANEQWKTESLRRDLTSVLDGLDSELSELSSLQENLEAAEAAQISALQHADEDLRPADGELKRLVKAQRRIDQTLKAYREIEELMRLQIRVADEAKSEKAAAGQGLSVSVVNAFSKHIRRRLEAWNYPDAEYVRYDANSGDVIDSEQARADHGKGVRAILHAGFTMGLADYCFANGLPHPGFVVIDSPLVTYRPPKAGEVSEPSSLDRSVIGRFYSDLEVNLGGQVIVLENTDPPRPIEPPASDIAFTKSDVGRYGLFPRWMGSVDSESA